MSVTVSKPPAFLLGTTVSVTANFSAEQRPNLNAVQTEEMLRTTLDIIKKYSFVLWDESHQRGWLLDGATAALHLVRGRLYKKQALAGDVDFSSLWHIDETKPSSAFDVLDDPENHRKPLWDEEWRSTEKEKRARKLDDQPQTEQTTVTLGLFILWTLQDMERMVDVQKVIDIYGSLLGAIRSKLLKCTATSSIKGWDYYELITGPEAPLHATKIKDLGWLALAKELNAIFIFGDDFGEIMRPRPGSCCPHFQTVPTGQNYLAVGIEALRPLFDKYHKSTSTDAHEFRLSLDLCWDSPVRPFADRPCRPEPHLNNITEKCLPVQLIKHNYQKHPERKNEPVKGPTLMRRGTYAEMVRQHPDGVIVFGKKQPNQAELKKLARPVAPSQPVPSAAGGARGTAESRHSTVGGNDPAVKPVTPQPPPDGPSSRGGHASDAAEGGGRVASGSHAPKPEPAAHTQQAARPANDAGSLRSSRSGRGVTGGGRTPGHTQQPSAARGSAPVRRTPSRDTMASNSSASSYLTAASTGVDESNAVHLRGPSTTDN